MITAVTYSDKVCTDVPLEELVELNNTMISKDANSTLTPASKIDSRINRARR